MRLGYTLESRLREHIYPFFLGIYLNVFKGYVPLKIDKDILNSGFYCFIKEKNGKKFVLKYPKLYKIHHKESRDRNKNKEFVDFLLSLKDLPYLSKHIGEITKVYPNRAHECAFEEGHNLKLIFKNLTQANTYNNQFKEDLTHAINDLVNSINDYKKKYGKEYICGDWLLHNLIYNPEKNRIINVDIADFYVWRYEGDIQNDINYLMKNLQDLLSLLRPVPTKY